MKRRIRILLFLFVLSFPLSMSAQTIDYLRPPKRPTTHRVKKPKPKQQESAEDMYIKGYDYLMDDNYTQAAYWFRKAADKGYRDAQSCMGYCYGAGVANTDLATESIAT